MLNIITSLLLLSFPTLATPLLDLKIDLAVKGRPIQNSRVFTKVGETASVITKGTYLEVVAVEQKLNAAGKPTVKMQFVVGTLSAKGEKNLLSEIHVLSVLNERAEVEEINDTGRSLVKLGVVASLKE